MSEIESVKEKSQQEQSSNSEQAQKKPKTINEKLRKKLEKLKKDDPNIYPVF